MKDFKLKEFGKGVLVILSYFIGANLLAALFTALIAKNIIPFLDKIYYILVYIIVATCYILLYKKDLLKNFNDYKKNYKKYLKVAFNYWLKGIFIMIISNYILIYIFKLSKSTNEAQNIMLLKENPISQTILIMFLAPLIEELVFRFSFRNMTKNKHLFSFITGIIFGLLHVLTSLENPLMILLLIPYSSMGIALGYAYKETNNIFSSLTVHIVHNTLTLIIIIIGISIGAV